MLFAVWFSAQHSHASVVAILQLYREEQKRPIQYEKNLRGHKSAMGDAFLTAEH